MVPRYCKHVGASLVTIECALIRLERPLLVGHATGGRIHFIATKDNHVTASCYIQVLFPVEIKLRSTAVVGDGIGGVPTFPEIGDIVQPKFLVLRVVDD